MDYILNIIIPKKEVEVVKLNEKLVTWADSVYSCEPPQYFTDSNIIFEKINDMKFYNKILGEELTDDTIILNLKSDMLFDLEYAVNRDETALEKNELLTFLMELYELSEFYILIVREDEKVKNDTELHHKKKLALDCLNV